MAKKTKMRTLRAEVERLRPDVEDVEAEIAAGHVLVEGVPATNPNTRVAVGTSVVVRPPKVLRGLHKIRAALEAFDLSVEGRVGLDAGASAGGFVQGLLEAGARRVYAVDVGYGQLLGSLRQDERVVNLERTNVGALDRSVIRDPVDVVTLDLGFLALATGVPQLNAIDFGPRADLIALVKPMAELALPAPPEDEPSLAEARDRAAAGIEGAGWAIVAGIRSPVRGSRGAIEMLLHARRR